MILSLRAFEKVKYSEARGWRIPLATGASVTKRGRLGRPLRPVPALAGALPWRARAGALRPARRPPMPRGALPWRARAGAP